MLERLQKILARAGVASRRGAEELIRSGRVTVNGKIAKPSADVKPGDVLEIRFGAKTLRARVDSVQEFAKKEQAAEMYTLLSDPVEEAE